ncbi:DUF1990 family protein [Brevibacterium aurantiacum]|uniref:DUF1990 family protein n=1 Tax=Brevibacterium aurantiacum TaxID=273384 RepID=A0A556CCA4_BREAU|nr:DUF1990 family protein [Brevibacterium aurantiacum]TSI15072.1 DUF1990 family protein [Brevibacterium aurantiacum]
MNRLKQTLDLGPAEVLPMAREAILTWKLQESAGVIARPVRRVQVGQVVNLWLNPTWPLPAPRLRGRELTVPVGSCEVIEVIDAESAAGFVYRTLPGHLESGEQTFLVSVGSDGRLGVSITSESVPGRPLLKAAAPMPLAAQKMMALRYVVGLKRMLQQASVRGTDRQPAAQSAMTPVAEAVAASTRTGTRRSG